jgi:DNA-binding winged helix-turn-helix (wHTH) protein
MFRVGEWLVHPELNCTVGGGRTVHVEPKVMEVLVFLAERAGDVVSREKLIEAVWDGAFVTDDALTRCISVLRKVFADDATVPRVIQTIPKRGYRLIAPVVAPASAENGLGSLAVLPFVSAGADPDLEYLGEVFVERIIDCLAQVPELRVTARSAVARYKGREIDPREVGRELGVGAVLTGSVVEWRDTLIIRAELVNAAIGWRLWGAHYERKLSEVTPVAEKEIARDVSKGVRDRLNAKEGNRPSAGLPASMEVHRPERPVDSDCCEVC